MSFGWSAGDIATAISIVVKICKALDDTFGASSEYRDITLFLGNLRYTLDKLLKISENPELENAAQLREQVDIMRPKVTSFLELIDRKYGKSLGEGSSRRFRAVAGKLEWAAMTSTKAKELRDSIGSNMLTIDRIIQFEIYASVQTKIPTQLKAGFSSVETHLTNTIQPLHADVSQILFLMQEQNPLIAKALEAVSRGTSPQPPPYSPPPIETIPPSLVVATIMNRYKLLASKKPSSGFELSNGQQETTLISSAALGSLGSWLKSPDSEILWIREAPSTKKSLSVSAAFYAAGKYSKTPIIGHSMLKGESWVDEDGNARQTLANIIASLVHQLVEKLPELTKSRTGREKDSSLAKTRLSVLGQQNLKAIKASLSILKDLVDLVTDPFLVILDCFEKYSLVRDKMAQDKTQQLLDIFIKKSMVKMFFSVSDRSHLNGFGGMQSRTCIVNTLKQERTSVLVNPTLVDMLD